MRRRRAADSRIAAILGHLELEKHSSFAAEEDLDQ